MDPPIGPERPKAPFLRGVYTGDRPELRHKTAYIARRQDGWNVQCDDMGTGFGLGWWWFAFEDWRAA